MEQINYLKYEEIVFIDLGDKPEDTFYLKVNIFHT